METNTATTATLEIDPRVGVPSATTTVAGWTCAGCRKPADETRSLWYLRAGGRVRVWHPDCR